jgi:hypothetical protein
MGPFAFLMPHRQGDKGGGVIVICFQQRNRPANYSQF